MNQYKNIVLVGMPGSGKTTIGKILATKLSMDYIDTDDKIEEKAQMTITDLFKNHGEMYFRNIETQVSKEVGVFNGKVIATGGGLVLKEENINNLRSNGIIIFLDRPLELIFNDIDDNKRPLLKNNKDHLHNLYKERYSLYCQRSDYKIINDQPLEIVIQKIEKLWSKLGE